jgi:hypothetical protein
MVTRVPERTEQVAGQPRPDQADARTIVTVAPGFNADAPAGDGLTVVERLTAALREADAAIAVASPFARGGRLKDPSWLARMALAWDNTFLSLAAHGEIATVIGTIRVIRQDAFARLVEQCKGLDLDAELLLEARKQGVRIIELPFELKREPGAHRFAFASLRAAAARSLARLRTGLRYRPALWLALPGLVPGLLPLVIGLLLIFRATPAQAAFWTVLTLIVQYGSLAIFSWQTTSFVARRLRRNAVPQENVVSRENVVPRS